MPWQPCISVRDLGENNQNSKRHAEWDQLCYLPTGRAGDTTMVRVRFTHNAQRTKAEGGAEQGGQKKKEWKSEMNDGGNLGFPAMTFEVGGGGGRGHEARRRGRSSKTANAWSSWPKHLQVTSVGRKCNRKPLADWFIWRLSQQQQQQQQQWQQHTQRGFLDWQVFMQYENLGKKNVGFASTLS